MIRYLELCGAEIGLVLMTVHLLSQTRKKGVTINQALMKIPVCGLIPNPHTTRD